MLTFETKTGLQARIDEHKKKFLLLREPRQPETLRRSHGMLVRWRLKLGDAAVLHFRGQKFPQVLSAVTRVR